MNNEVTLSTKSNITYNSFNIPQEVIELLWIEDGPLKNYFGNRFMPDKKYNINGITVSVTHSPEPSLISTKLPIRKPDDLNAVEKLDYYPSYESMTPEQRFKYLHWLQNPYEPIDIGYVFVFYYGLERHLIEGHFEKAFNMILKLRKIHSNGSFQLYSFNALLLSSMLADNLVCFEQLDSTLNKSSPNFDLSIYIAVKKHFGLSLSCEEIISLAGNVKFQNKRYIRNNYSDFIMCLQDILIERYGEVCIQLSAFDSLSCKSSVTCFVANTSFDYHIRECHYPNLIECQEFKETIYSLLQATHEKVKSYLAEQRKDK